MVRIVEIVSTLFYTYILALDRTSETTHLIFGDFNKARAFNVLKQSLQFINEVWDLFLSLLFLIP
jgi:hypothetical protein